MKSKRLMFILLPAVFIVIGVIILANGIKSVAKAKESVNWPSCTGVIVSSEMGRHTDSDSGTTYSADIVYEFTVNSDLISSGKVKFGKVNTSNPSDARKVLNKYPEGKEVVVYYSESDPYESVLEPGVHKSTWFLPGFGLAFASFGAIFMVVGASKKN